MNEKRPKERFSELFAALVHRSAYTPGQLASLSSVPKMTIVNWINGRVQKPRNWRRIIALALAMRLAKDEVNQLLAASNHPLIEELLMSDEADELNELVTFWQKTFPPIEKMTAPFQANPLPSYFVGREKEIRHLEAQLQAEHHTAVYCLHGMAGVGKTILATRLAYQMQAHFQDGVLWARVDSSEPMSILATFAQAFQEDVTHYHDIASRSRVVRTLLKNKKVLIVLDNVQSSAQIEPLLPPIGSCAVLITTRSPNLSILIGARRHEIRPFSPASADSLALFAKLLSQQRVDADKPVFQQMADRVGHLPLALVITASRLSYEADWTTQQFSTRLEQTVQRLNNLKFETISVRHSFDLSYNLLPQEVQQVFDLAGQLAKRDFTPATLSDILERPIEDILDDLRQLVSLSLVQRSKNGRFILHPLLHDYANSHLVDTHPHLFGYWQQFIADHRNAYPAIRQELEHIEVAIQSLSHRKEGHILGQILYDMGPLYIAWGDLQKIEGLLIQAIALIEPTKTILLGKLKLRLGQLKRHQMQYDQAEAHLRKGLALTENMGNNALKLQFLTEIGIVYNCKGQYSKGKHYLGQALAISQQESVGEPILTLFEELGTLAILENEAELAEKYQREGLALAVKLDQKINQVLFLKSLGALHHLNKKPADAAALFEQGLQISREIEYKKGEMLVYNNLGVVAFYNNEMVTAERHLRLSLDRSKKIHEYQAMRLILRNLAKWARQNGRLSQSKRYFEQLHALAEAQGWDDLATKVQGEIKQLSSGEKTPKSEHLRVFI